MKRAKQPNQYEEEHDPMRDLNIGADDLDYDDDIIELEDIIEMPDGSIDEDNDLDLDIEIFDVDSDLGTRPKKPAPDAVRPSGKEQAQLLESEDEDLIDSFGDELEDETLFDSAPSMESSKSPAGRSRPQVFDEDEETLLDEFEDKPVRPGTAAEAEEKVDLKARVAAAMKVAEEGRPAEVESEAAISDEPSAPEPEEAPAVSGPGLSAADLSQTAEELVSRIESRLQEHIRIMVESRLPDLVRSIINEEIEKLKEELQ